MQDNTGQCREIQENADGYGNHAGEMQGNNAGNTGQCGGIRGNAGEWNATPNPYLKIHLIMFQGDARGRDV